MAPQTRAKYLQQTKDLHGYRKGYERLKEELEQARAENARLASELEVAHLHRLGRDAARSDALVQRGKFEGALEFAKSMRMTAAQDFFQRQLRG